MAKLQCLGGDNCISTPSKVCDECSKPLCEEHVRTDPIDATQEICSGCHAKRLKFKNLGPVSQDLEDLFD